MLRIKPWGILFGYKCDSLLLVHNEDVTNDIDIDIDIDSIPGLTIAFADAGGVGGISLDLFFEVSVNVGLGEG